MIEKYFIYQLIICFLIASASSYTNGQNTANTENNCIQFAEVDTSEGKFDIESLYEAGRCWWKNGNTAQAKKFLELVNEEDSTALESRELLASIYRRERNYAVAAGLYKRLIEIDSTSAVNYRNYADMLRSSELYEDAINAYLKAVEKNPNDLRSRVKLADIFTSMNLNEFAQLQLDSILKIDSENLFALELSQKIAFRNDEWEKVLRLTEEINEIAELSTEVRRFTGYSYMKIDSTEEAIHIFRNILDKKKAHLTHLYLGMAYEKLGEMDEASFHYEMSVKYAIPKKLPFYMKIYASHLERANKFAEAYKQYKKAYELSSNPDYLFDLGRVSERAYADKEMAMRYYDAYLETDKTKYKKQAEQRLSSLRSANHMKN